MIGLTRAFIAIGANLGDPVSQVLQAVDALQQLPDIDVAACSALYTSSPMGPQDQPDYVNAVCKLDCASNLAALDLLDLLQAVESAAGRQRDADGVNANGRWGPRLLDLDLLLFGQQQIDSVRLTVPHPGLLERPFVLVPLLEIDPQIEVPGKGRGSDYLQQLPGYELQRLPDSHINLPVSPGADE